MKMQYGLVAFACSAVMVLRCCMKSEKGRKAIISNSKSRPSHHDALIEFQMMEKLIVGQTVATTTFFKGSIPTEFLQERVAAIVEANPWLAGRMEDSCRVSFPSTLGEREREHSFFKTVTPPEGVTNKTSQRRLLSLLKKYVLIEDDFGFGLFSVVAFPTEGGFILLTTICHTLVDACAFYQIYAMLNPENEIISLNSNRKEDEWDAMVYGPKDFPYVKFTLNGIICSVLKAVFPWVLPTDVYATYKVDQEYVASQKRNFKGEGFISTNDILSSWWFSNFPLKACSFIVCNMRGKVKALEDTLAGNYIATLLLLTEEERTAGGIRYALSNYQNVEREFKDPGMWYWITEPMCLTTNWSSFYSKLSFPNCCEEFHAPLVYVDGGDFCIIFRSSEEELCMFMQSSGSELPTGGPLAQQL